MTQINRSAFFCNQTNPTQKHTAGKLSFESHILSSDIASKPWTSTSKQDLVSADINPVGCKVLSGHGLGENCSGKNKKQIATNTLHNWCIPTWSEQRRCHWWHWVFLARSAGTGFESARENIIRSSFTKTSDQLNTVNTRVLWHSELHTIWRRYLKMLTSHWTTWRGTCLTLCWLFWPYYPTGIKWVNHSQVVATLARD